MEYLGSPEKYKADALFANARQMLAQYQQKRAQKEQDTLPMFYWPYTILTADKELNLLRKIKDDIRGANFKEAVSCVVK